jgi:hypothetical protein
VAAEVLAVEILEADGHGADGSVVHENDLGLSFSVTKA